MEVEAAVPSFAEILNDQKLENLSNRTTTGATAFVC
jgi:hypothetical protein